MEITAIKELLLKIQQASGWPRMEAIRSLQNRILNENDNPVDNMDEVLSDLAYDLNFYESEPTEKDERLGYYGDERLMEIVEAALSKIETG